MGIGDLKIRVIVGLLTIIPMLAISQSDTNLPINHYDLTTSNDTMLLNNYCTLQLDYSEANRDSSIFYGYKALALSQKMRQPFYEACTLSDLGFSLLSNGEYSEALNVLLEASKMAKNKDVAKNVMPTPYINDYAKGNPESDRLLLLGYIKNSLALLYGSTRNMQKQLQELLEARQIVESGTTNKHLLYTLTYNIANAYFNMNNMDSAMYYTRRVMEIEENFELNNYSGASLKNIGDIFYKKDKPDSAKKYYLEALHLIEKKNINTNYLALTQAALADLYRKNGQKDSSLYYARAAVKNYTALGSFIQQTVGYYTTLSQNFEDNNQFDSAYFYMQLSKTLSDSLNEKEIDRLSKFQQLGFDEQLRLKALESEQVVANNRKRTYLLLAGLGVFSIIAYMLFRNNQQRRKINMVLQEQKQKLETTVHDLKETQNQLIHAEKMASLGELTAGIAHEIQNPLNFVNNFSEVSTELVDEMNAEIAKGNLEDAKEIANDLRQNLEKINHHGNRAGDIVKGMLQHSRSSTGVKEPTDINKLADEYLRLAYHGLRAKDKTFNVTLKTDFDETIGKINIIPQDMGRVLLNLYNNAFYAAAQPQQAEFLAPGYKHEPVVWISTKKTGNKVSISVRDNGPGIPPKILDKIFQPFFTTKPTGQGTGLGLSLSYDIVKAHAGELKVETKHLAGLPAGASAQAGTEFIIQIPT
jgi:two-component system, NtrC family, sensor kinase